MRRQKKVHFVDDDDDIDEENENKDVGHRNEADEDDGEPMTMQKRLLKLAGHDPVSVINCPFSFNIVYDSSTINKLIQSRYFY